MTAPLEPIHAFEADLAKNVHAPSHSAMMATRAERSGWLMDACRLWRRAAPSSDQGSSSQPEYPR